MPLIQGDNFGSCGVSAIKQRPGKKVMRIHMGRPSSMGRGFAASRLSAIQRSGLAAKSVSHAADL